MIRLPIQRLTFAFALAASCTFAGAQDATTAVVNGRNVKAIYFTRDGKPVGVLCGDETGWRQITNGTSEYYRETDRDEWSVYLANRTTDERRQIDLFTKEVKVQPVGETEFKKWYDIHGSFSNVAVYNAPENRKLKAEQTGIVATSPNTASGKTWMHAFVRLGAGQWVLIGTENGGSGLLKSVSQGEWTIDLKNELSRTIILDRIQDPLVPRLLAPGEQVRLDVKTNQTWKLNPENPNLNTYWWPLIEYYAR